MAEPDLSFASARASEVTGPLAQLIEAELPRPIYGGMGVGGDRGPYTYTYLEIRVQKLG
ncbi:hypothetical protein HYX00_03180 [Candidatus Woesearchaeota archaeon]|nr:hypothetical protein [Candidatus Woesearchaeota archaeon]